MSVKHRKCDKCGGFGDRTEPCENHRPSELPSSTGSGAGSVRQMRIRSRALQLLDIAGYIPKPRLRQAMRIAARCETRKPPNAGDKV